MANIGVCSFCLQNNLHLTPMPPPSPRKMDGNMHEFRRDVVKCYSETVEVVKSKDLYTLALPITCAHPPEESSLSPKPECHHLSEKIDIKKFDDGFNAQDPKLRPRSVWTNRPHLYASRGHLTQRLLKGRGRAGCKLGGTSASPDYSYVKSAKSC